MPKVLIVEDDAAVAEVVQEWLEMSGYTVDVVYDGDEGLYRLRNSSFDLAILDWHLPGLTGLEVCTRYRSNGGQAAILMLTQRNSASAKVEGLESGADDYLTKPFDGNELVARVRALLRRPPMLLSKRLETTRLVLDYDKCSVSIDGKLSRLLPREFELVQFLLKNPHKYFSSEELLKHVWSSESEVGPETVRVCISRIRTKVNGDSTPSLIETAKGWGYKIADTYLVAPEPG